MQSRVKKISLWDIVPIEFAELISELILIATVIDGIRFPKEVPQETATVSKTETVQDKETAYGDLPDEAKKETEKFLQNFHHSFSDERTFDKKANSKRAFANFVKGWREIGGKRYYYKSLWEINFSRYLEYIKKNKEIKDWQYEPKTFWFEEIRRGVRSYKPDFRTIDFDGEEVWYEVKGFLDNKSLTKIQRMRKYYPNIRLIVINSKWFSTKGKQYSALIEGWEKKPNATDSFLT